MKKQIVFLLIGLGIIFSAFVLIMNACTPAYPVCDASKLHAFRCNGATVEMCDGETWNPRYDCEEIYLPDGTMTLQQCIQDGDTADCEPQ
jgi:hypothetical protein